MTQFRTPPTLSDIQSASSLPSQVAALRSLKNEIIGHDQKKEAWIRNGLISELASILSRRDDVTKRAVDVNGNTKSNRRASRSGDDELMQQAMVIVGSLAQGMLHDSSTVGIMLQLQSDFL